MSLVVEDGSGVIAAESYADAGFLRSFRSVAGRRVPTACGDEARDALLEERIEAALVAGSAYVDYLGCCLWPGRKLSEGQRLAWPREGACSEGGEALGGVPAPVLCAACEASLLELAEPGILWRSESGNGRIRAEREGGRQVSYERGTGGSRRFPEIHALLFPILGRGGGLRVERG